MKETLQETLQETRSSKPSLRSLGKIRRRSVALSAENLVETGFLDDVPGLPRVLRPAVEGVHLTTWAQSHQEFLSSELLRYAGILFRGFDLGEIADFQHFIDAFSQDLLEYTYRSTPRTQVSGNIYTSTEYPADQPIPMHNEMSYSLSWPLKIWFFCVTPAQSGGATPFADSRRVYREIPPDIRECFERKKVMYVRNYAKHIDLPWQEVFQTESRQEVEEFCHRAEIELEWLDDQHLRTRQICQAVATHPKSGEKVWFNQAHLFHLSSLPPEVQQAFLSQFGEENLARNAYYGDGSPIEPETLDEIREVYRRESVAFPWQSGDLVMLDNMLAAHGREPFTGARKVVVGMADMVESAEVLG